MSPIERKQFGSRLIAIAGDESVIDDPKEIQSFLRDNSWLSPILSQHFEQMRESSGQSMSVDAVVAPESEEQLSEIIGLAVQFGVPIVCRGGGTSNFGQTMPVQGGLIVDIRRLNRVLEVTEDTVTAQAGAIQGDVDKSARSLGKELSLLTTTYASATIAGWVAGGHVGLGTSMYGTIWDGNVVGIKMLTAEETPRRLSLKGEALLPLLHTYGTTGVMTEVTLPVREARDWLEAVVVFEDFDDAARFTSTVAQDLKIRHRVAAAQQAPIPATFSPLKHLYDDKASVVLMILDSEQAGPCRSLVSDYRGEFHIWKRSDEPRRIPLAYMVYGHRMLWIKKVAPQAAFLHCYLTPTKALDQIHSLKERFGSDLWIEMKYMRSRWLRLLHGLTGEGVLAAPVLTLVPGTKEFLEKVMEFCRSIDVTYQNPHTFVLEETGLFRDFDKIIEFKKQTDPKGLLNPGKIGAKFFSTMEQPLR
jgi:FAD/FMN-containing dehydrogenase